MLPSPLTLDDYRTLRRDITRQRPAIVVIAERHRLPVGELAPFARGTHLVWGTRDVVIKLFAPLWPEDVAVEVTMLEHLTGADLPVPQLVARGELAESWRYVVMTRLPGERIGDVWPSLSADEREQLACNIGETMARVGTLPTAGLERLVMHQDALLEERLPRLLRDQRERGGDDKLEAELRAFLDDLPRLVPADSVLLHADLTDDHFLVEDGRVVGLIDFADAFVGPWTYELAAPACFVTYGDTRAQAAMLAGYGMAPEPELLRTVSAWVVLHRYWYGADMIRRVGSNTLEEWLEGLWSTLDAPAR